MATKSLKKSVAIEVECRTQGAVDNLAKLSAETKKARDNTEKLDARLKGLADGITQSAGASGRAAAVTAEFGEKATKAGKHAFDSSKLVERLGFAAHQVVGQTASLNQALQGVLMTLGPWGIAIGAAAGAVLHFVEANHEATDSVRKQREELRLRREELAKAASEANYRDVVKERRSAAADYTGVAGLRDTEAFLEEEAARLRARGGKPYSELVSAQARARAEILKAEADIERAGGEIEKAHSLDLEAGNVLRRDRLRLIDEEQQAIVDREREAERDAKRTRRVVDLEKQRLDLLIKQGLNQARLAKIPEYLARDGSDTREFAAAANDLRSDAVGEALSRDRAPRDAGAVALSKRDRRLREVEVERAQDLGGEGEHDREIQRIEARRDAQRSYYDTLLALENDDAKRRELREQKADAEHQAVLGRLREEAEAREESAARTAEISQRAGDLAGAVAQAFLTAGDFSARGLKKAVAGVAAAEAIRMGVYAVSETVEAIVSAARYDFPGAAKHGAAAAKAAAGAVALGALAAGLGAGGGALSKNVRSGITGDSFGPGSAATEERPTTSNSQKDTTPLSSSERALQRTSSANAGAASGSGAVTVINVTGTQVLGAVDDQSALKLYQGITRAQQRLGKLAG